MRLSQCLKKDIRIVIDILLHGSGKTYSDITNDVGMRLGGKTFSYVSPLERIYPEYESYLKREVIPLLESVLSDYNKDFPCYLRLNANAINEIIEYSFKKGNETFLVSIIGITKEYFSPSYFGYEGLWSHVRSLAAAVESLVKHISKQKHSHMVR